VLGSLERFIAILLEHYQGNLPLWLAPEQVVVAPVADAQIDYAVRVVDELERGGVRVVLDRRAETLARRVVDARERAIPVFVAVGKREERDRTVSVRFRSGESILMSLADAVQEIGSRSRAVLVGADL
jgi:threonyl-tRNA synthetase